MMLNAEGAASRNCRAVRALSGLVGVALLCAALSACGAKGEQNAVPPTGSTTSSTPGLIGSAEDFCAAVTAINEIPDSDVLSPAEREHALEIIDNLLRLWPAETNAAAQTYFGELRKTVEAGTAVDLDNTSTEFQEAFAIVFEYAADTCPGGFG